MKRFAAILMAIVGIMCFSACEEKAEKNKEMTVEDAYLEGWDACPFDKALKEESDKIVKAAADKEITYSVVWGKGWQGDSAPDSKALSDKEKAVMCEIRFKITEGEATETKRLRLYMIHKTEENLLTIEGGEDIRKIFVKDLSAEETREIIMDFLEGKYR